MSTYDFQFYPAPKKSSLMPIQLPSRAVVDMGLSGRGMRDQLLQYAVAWVPVKELRSRLNRVRSIRFTRQPAE